MIKEMNPTIVEIDEDFTVFMERNRDSCNEQDLLILYLKIYKSLSNKEIATYLKIRNIKVSDVLSRNKIILQNERNDLFIDKLKELKIDRDRLIKIKAAQMRSVMKEIKRRCADEERFKSLSEKELQAIFLDLSKQFEVSLKYLYEPEIFEEDRVGEIEFK